MEEIYWITRLDGILDVSTTLLIISIIATVISVLYLIINDKDDCDRYKAKTTLWISTPILILSILIYLFVPSKNDMFLIYGLGSTMEYVKGNDKFKEIPDKAVDALLEYFDGKEDE